MRLKLVQFGIGMRLSCHLTLTVIASSNSCNNNNSKQTNKDFDKLNKLTGKQRKANKKVKM